MLIDDRNAFSKDINDKVTKLLVRARTFLERGWCQNTLAIDADGKTVSTKSCRTVAWCAMGAIIAAGPGKWGWGAETTGAIKRVNLALSGEDIVDFNNRQETVEPVLAVFDRAIADESY